MGYYGKCLAWLFFACMLFSLFACTSNEFEADVSDIHIDLEIKRLDVDMFSLNPDPPDQYVPYLQDEYGEFLDMVNMQILNIGSSYEDGYYKRLQGFTNHPNWKQVFEYSQELYPDLSDVEEELEDALRHYKYYFPGKEIPQIYSFISGFNHTAVTYENTIGIGLDMYLGSDCEFYDRAYIYQYQQTNMHKGRIVTDCMTAWVSAQFPFNDSINDLISNMIYQGKLMYFVHAMLPYTPDSVKFGYTGQKLDWCKDYEENMWTYFVEENRLFDNSRMEIAKFINDAPFTAPFHKQSAPRTGVFIGFKIVKSFMKQNPDLTLAQLMELNNYHQILNRSKYKP